MRFPPSVVEAEARVGRSSLHLQGRNEVENRNGACVMEVAAMGSREKLRTKEGGKLQKHLGGMQRSGMQARPYCDVLLIVRNVVIVLRCLRRVL